MISPYVNFKEYLITLTTVPLLKIAFVSLQLQSTYSVVYSSPNQYISEIISTEHNVEYLKLKFDVGLTEEFFRSLNTLYKIYEIKMDS